jgi:hypothetical protein
MKIKILVPALVMITCFAGHAQSSNAIFFAENGESFNLVLNGILQNEKPETNVKLTGLNAPSYKSRIIFNDKSLGFVDYNLNFVTMGNEVSYTIKKNSKGAYVVRYVSEVPLAQAPPPAPNQTVIAYTVAPPVGATTTTTQHQTTTTTTGNPENVSINMGVNVDGQGGNMNMNVSGMENNVHSSSTTTTTTTHTTTSTSSTIYEDPAPAQPVQVVYVDGYNGRIGCPVPMSRSDFDSFKSSVTSKSFEESKMTLAKQVLNTNCLTSAQVREVMSLFTFEDTKLDFAKYAYGHTYDLGNYYKVNDAFQFESSIEDLNNYIGSHR